MCCPQGLLKCLGVYIHPHGDLWKEFDQIIDVAWRLLHAKKVFRKTPGGLHAELGILPLRVYPTMAWTSGTPVDGGRAAAHKGNPGTDDAQNRANGERGMVRFLATLLFVVLDSMGAGRGPKLGRGGCRILAASGGACCPIGAEGAGTMVRQSAAVEGRLVSPYDATVEHYRTRVGQLPQQGPQALGKMRWDDPTLATEDAAMHKTAKHGGISKIVSSHAC